MRALIIFSLIFSNTMAFAEIGGHKAATKSAKVTKTSHSMSSSSDCKAANNNNAQVLKKRVAQTTPHWKSNMETKRTLAPAKGNAERGS